MRLRYDVVGCGAAVDLRERRWFQWGLIIEDGETVAWYWLLRLPSYLMKQAAHRAPWCYPTWHQLCLVWVEPMRGPFKDGQGLTFVELALA